MIYLHTHNILNYNNNILLSSGRLRSKCSVHARSLKKLELILIDWFRTYSDWVLTKQCIALDQRTNAILFMMDYFLLVPGQSWIRSELCWSRYHQHSH